MRDVQNFELDTRGSLCDSCGVPLDAEHFDESSLLVINAAVQQNRPIVLAEFQLPPQYCGLLQCFSQFSLRHSRGGSPLTRGIEWSLRSNGHPLFPYQSMEAVLNPWGYGSYPVSIRLDEGARLDLIVRILDLAQARRAGQIGGRIMGRFWYNAAYGGSVGQ